MAYKFVYVIFFVYLCKRKIIKKQYELHANGTIRCA